MKESNKINYDYKIFEKNKIIYIKINFNDKK